jgi:hypothetical protein
MVAALNLYFAFHFMTIITDPLDLGMLNFYMGMKLKRIYKFFTKHSLYIKNTNMATVYNFEFLPGKFNAFGICVIVSYGQKCITNF